MLNLIAISKLLIFGTWAYSLSKLWKYRAKEHANLAVVGAVSVVLFGGLHLLNVPMAPETIVFFLAMGQLAIATSLIKLVTYAYRNELNKEEKLCYSHNLLVICGAAVAGAVLQVLPIALK